MMRRWPAGVLLGLTFTLAVGDGVLLFLLREEVHLDALTAELTGAVMGTMHPGYVSVWVKDPGRGSPSVRGSR